MSDFAHQSEKRFSPVNFQQKYNQYGYYQQPYGQKSPYSLHTPETSPTHSPEPKSGLKPPKSPQDSSDSKEDGTPSLPTPELSPLEQEYSEEKNRMPSIHPAASQSYTTRVQNFRYTDSQPITSVPMANGMYVMCANKSSVEQGHVVTGTFYPPVATSQDQQLLGTSQPQSSSLSNSSLPGSSSSTIHYYGTNQIPHYYPGAGYKEDAMHLVNSHEVIMDKPTYESMMNDHYAGTSAYNNPLVHSYIPQNEERSDIDSDVDTREFDKYLKFSNQEAGIVDSNHNYHSRNDVGYNFQAQHTSVILPNTNIKPEPMIAHYPEMYTPELPQNGIPKTDDDFSEILADVRKTCYSN